uniref:Ribosomal protein S4 n=1 Tax=Helicosporidium sp. subsp. Simulium jonesii TaxID=145475 RepID=D3IZW2_HELSJ|nr:ribosomal protein S4 [Helicosporidium sp. ex Simulium jonesi]ACT36188.1 ribosomal protein S4 [Helicosporidium sp. ex Simulium jonesi]
MIKHIYQNTKEKKEIFASFDSYMTEFSSLQNTRIKKTKKPTGASLENNEFKNKLDCLQKLKIFYGNISTKQLLTLIRKAQNLPGFFDKNFFSLIESRLDVILYRSNFAKSIYHARQLCYHKKILLNSKFITVPSTLLKPGDVLVVHENSIPINTNKFTNIPSKNFKKYYFNLNIINILKNINNLNISSTSSNVSSILINKDILNLLNQLSYINSNDSFIKKVAKQSKTTKKLSIEATQDFNKINLKTLLFYLTNNKHLVKQLISYFEKQNYLLSETIKAKLLKNKNLLAQNQEFNQKKVPLNLEINPNTNTLIYLYSPQRILLPFILDTDLIRKLLKFKTAK